MASPAARGTEHVRKRGIQIDPAKGGFSGEVVAAGPKRQCAPRRQYCLEIRDQRSTDTASTPFLGYDYWVQLPLRAHFQQRHHPEHRVPRFRGCITEFTHQGVPFPAHERD